MTAAQINARECARRPNGEFGNQEHSAPTPVTLDHTDATDRHLSRHELEREVFARAARVAQHIGGRAGLRQHEIEELRQEAVTEFLAALRSQADKQRDESAHTTVGTLRSMLGSTGLLYRCFEATLQRQRFDPKHYSSKDIQAYALLQQEEAQFRSAHGREMTRAERDNAADQIRLSSRFRPSDRPHIGFQNFSATTVSIDQPVGSGEDTSQLSDLIADDRTYLVQHTPERAQQIEAILDQREHDHYDTIPGDSEITNMSRAKRREYGLEASNAWPLFSQAAGLPPAREGTKPELVGYARAVMKEYPGGCAQMARDWLNGDISDEEAVPLFAPFGDLSIREQDEIARAFTVHDRYADDLWRSASTACRRRASQ